MQYKTYLDIKLAFNNSNYEQIYNTLYLHGITSILEENKCIQFTVPDKHLNLFKQIKNELITNKIITENDISFTKFQNRNWNKEWEKTIEPVLIKEKIIIYPSWKKKRLKNTSDKILIEIDPKMSFGTGRNETTRLILELMCDYISSTDKRMLDYGCGTGILAIAGIKLGLQKAVAIDIDDDSIENAKEYLRINNVERSIVLRKADITGIKEKNFDIICANITSGVILVNLKNIYSKLKSKGKLFITGILIEEKDGITSALKENNFEIKEIHDKEEWTGFYVKKFE